MSGRLIRIAVLYPSDPFGFVPSGIDSFIRGILKWAPEGLEYTLFGATTNPVARPVGQERSVPGVHGGCKFIPLLAMDPVARRSGIPLTIRYMWALRRSNARGAIAGYDILDFQRPEPVTLFRGDARPKNLVLHQDMAVIRGRDSDILWRHMPWLYERVERRVLASVDHVFCVRESAVERYRLSYPDCAAKFEFIPTWVDTETFAPAVDAESRDIERQSIRAELELPQDSRLLVFVGRLDRQKDPLLLLDAFATAQLSDPRLRLLVVGDGALRPAIEKRIRTTGIADLVLLLGAVPRERIAELLRASDLFVSSSAYEGMPIAVLEALATGLPVASTDVGEIRRVVRNGVNGAISRERTAVAIAEALSSALASLDSLRGPPCLAAVAPFGPESVLGRLYELHRSQARPSQGVLRSA